MCWHRHPHLRWRIKDWVKLRNVPVFHICKVGGLEFRPRSSYSKAAFFSPWNSYKVTNNQLLYYFSFGKCKTMDWSNRMIKSRVANSDSQLITQCSMCTAVRRRACLCAGNAYCSEFCGWDRCLSASELSCRLSFKAHLPSWRKKHLEIK